jgi:hypothetical protein
VRGGNNNNKFGEMEVWKYLPAPELASSCETPWYLAFRADNSKKRKDTKEHSIHRKFGNSEVKKYLHSQRREQKDNAG